MAATQGRWTMESTLKVTDPQELMDEHLDALRGYAEHVITRGGVLTEYEERDKAERMTEYMAIGKSLDLTSRDLMAQIFGDMLKPEESQCGCPTCRNRARREDHLGSDDDLSVSGV